MPVDDDCAMPVGSSSSSDGGPGLPSTSPQDRNSYPRPNLQLGLADVTGAGPGSLANLLCLRKLGGGPLCLAVNALHSPAFVGPGLYAA